MKKKIKTINIFKISNKNKLKKYQNCLQENRKHLLKYNFKSVFQLFTKKNRNKIPKNCDIFNKLFFIKN